MNKIANLKIVEKMKLWLVAVLVLIVAGSVVWGIVGLNKDSSYKGYTQVTVNVASTVAAEDIKKDTEKYFKDNGITVVSRKVAGEQVYMYEVKTRLVNVVLKESLETALKAHKNWLGTPAVKVAEAKASTTNAPALWALLAFGVSAVAVFIYALIRYKWRRALALIGSILLSVYLTICLTAICRIPVGTNYVAAIGFTFVFSGVVTLYYINKVKEFVRSSGYKGVARIDIANAAASNVFVKTLAIAIAAVVILAAGVIFAATPVKFVLISAIVGVVVSTAVAITVAPTLYAYLGKGGIYKKNDYTPKVIASSDSAN